MVFDDSETNIIEISPSSWQSGELFLQGAKMISLVERCHARQ
jgi:hypothetical protein